MNARALRTIRESTRFTRERDELNPNVRRMDEILEGICWIIVRDPEQGQQTAAEGIRAIPTTHLPGAPALVLYYSWDDTYVDLQSIRYADPEAVADEGDEAD